MRCPRCAASRRCRVAPWSMRLEAPSSVSGVRERYPAGGTGQRVVRHSPLGRREEQLPDVGEVLLSRALALAGRVALAGRERRQAERREGVPAVRGGREPRQVGALGRHHREGARQPVPTASVTTAAADPAPGEMALGLGRLLGREVGIGGRVGVGKRLRRSGPGIGTRGLLRRCGEGRGCGPALRCGGRRDRDRRGDFRGRDRDRRGDFRGRRWDFGARQRDLRGRGESVAGVAGFGLLGEGDDRGGVVRRGLRVLRVLRDLRELSGVSAGAVISVVVLLC